MKKPYSILWILFSLLLTLAPTGLPAKDQTKELSTRANQAQTKKYDTPIAAVKTFFTALKDKDFDLAWESLTAASRNQFIQTFAASQGISTVRARELFENNKDVVRPNFWNPMRDRSKIIPQIQNATYTMTDEKDNQAVVEMKSGGITNHIKAFKEGNDWKMGYVESGLQEDKPLTAPPAPKAEKAPAPATH